NAMDAMEDTPEAQRRLSLRTHAHGDDAVEIVVADNGRGIEPERLPNLFDSFYTTKAEGMGMGLSIARAIVLAHQGHIRAENVPGGGAAFHVVIPAMRGEQAPDASTAADIAVA